MERNEELELSPDQWREGKKSTPGMGNDTTRLEIWVVHPSRSSQGTESGKDSGKWAGQPEPSDVSSWAMS